MPKLKCRCGYIHNLSGIPDDGYLILMDKDYDSLLELENKRGALTAGKPQAGTAEWDELINADAEVLRILERLYECPECKTLIWRRKNGKFYFYDFSEVITQLDN